MPQALAMTERENTVMAAVEITRTCTPARNQAVTRSIKPGLRSPNVARRILGTSHGAGSTGSAALQSSNACRTSATNSRQAAHSPRCLSTSTRRTVSSCPSRYSLTRFSSSRWVMPSVLFTPHSFHTLYRLRQFQPSAIDSRFHRPLRHLQHLGDLVVVEILKISQDHGFAHVRRKLV